MLKNKLFLINKRIIGSVLAMFIILYTALGLLNYSQAAYKETYTQTVRSGIDAFPESYQGYLRKLKEQHPNWTFDAYYTGISWSDLVKYETDHQHNRIIKSADPLWKCSCNNVASGYACASPSITQYYMDPRNFLDNDTRVFQFLESSYNNNYKVEVVQSIIKNSFMKGEVTFQKDGKQVTMSYANIIMDAAKESQMSPYSIAIKILQEVGSGGSNSVTGTYQFVHTDGKTYTGYYNFFNYGSYDTGDAITNGLRAAKDNGWDTPYKSIIGGAKKYGANYNSKGQNTLYFTKWDVVGTKILKPGETQTVVASSGSDNQLFRHQYMTNVQDPRSQSSKLYNTYSNNNIIGQGLNFLIPVYNDMPVANKMPTNLTSADGDLYYTTGTDIMLRAEPNTGGARVDCVSERDIVVVVIDRKVSHDGTRYWDKVKLANGKTGYMASQYLEPCGIYKEKKAEITDSNVKAIPNLSVKDLVNELKITDYEITKDGNKKADTDPVGTGYILKDKSNNKEYVMIVMGDVNGDAEINSGDLLTTKKHLLQTAVAQGEKKTAMDVNKDNEINSGDLLLLKKHLLGSSNIKI